MGPISLLLTWCFFPLCAYISPIIWKQYAHPKRRRTSTLLYYLSATKMVLFSVGYSINVLYLKFLFTANFLSLMRDVIILTSVFPAPLCLDVHSRSIIVFFSSHKPVGGHPRPLSRTEIFLSAVSEHIFENCNVSFCILQVRYAEVILLYVVC